MCNGYLEIIIGPMFSGKTSSLIPLFRRFTKAKKNVLVVNYAGDTRYSTSHLSTHDGQMIPCTMTYKLENVHTTAMESDVILVNECQFFADLKEYIPKWVDDGHKRVYICGLDGDYKRQMFGDTLSLVPLADKVIKLTSICEDCGDDAPFTFRYPSDSNGDQIQIGVKEYKACCRRCYQEETKKVA